MLLSNRVAIVTGAAGGIGGGIATRFAQEGCDVAVVDLNLDGANKKAEELKKLGRDSIAVQADITKSAQVEAMVKKVIEKFGKIDILINTAGTLFDVAMPGTASIADIPEDHWDRLLDINLKGCFLVNKYVVPYMKEKKYGKIVNFSSLGAIFPPAVCPHYNAAKAGIMGMTLDMAAELGPFNITVNSILPGCIVTTFYDKINKSLTKEQADARFANMIDGAPLGRTGTPDDIAGPVLFLASEMSSYVTGVNLSVTGGQPLRSHV